MSYKRLCRVRLTIPEKNEGKTPLGASHVWTYKKNAWKRCVSAVPKQYAIIKGDLVPERIFTRGAKQQTDGKKIFVQT